MSDINKKIGRNIRAIRKSRGYTQEKLGEKSGISYKFIGEMERGEVNPSLNSIILIAKALGVNARELFPDDSDRIHAIFSPRDIKQIKKALQILNAAFSRL
jgi:transcriptional regulator with XRE-family HTH domain